MQNCNTRANGGTLTISIPILLAIAGLLLLLGALAIAAIFLVAAKCRCKLSVKDRKANDDAEQVDPWAEAGRRHKDEFPEQENNQKESA